MLWNKTQSTFANTIIWIQINPRKLPSRLLISSSGKNSPNKTTSKCCSSGRRGKFNHIISHPFFFSTFELHFLLWHMNDLRTLLICSWKKGDEVAAVKTPAHFSAGWGCDTAVTHKDPRIKRQCPAYQSSGILTWHRVHRGSPWDS